MDSGRISAQVMAAVASLAAVAAIGAAPARAAYPGLPGRIAFARAGGIYSAAPNGTGVARLTTAAGDSSPVWSPDGRRIAFVRAGQIWTMRSDGSGQAAVTSVGTNYHPTWSPDGAWLAFDSSRGSTFGSQIYKLRSAPRYGKAIRLTLLNPLPGDCRANRSPTWSSTGKIAFVHDSDSCDESDSVQQVFTMSPSGSGQTRVPGTRCACYDSYADWGQLSPLDWSPNGSTVVFDSLVLPGDGPGFWNGAHILSRALAGTTTADLSSQLPAYYYDLDPAVSPAGTGVVFDRRYLNPYQGPTGTEKQLGIWIMDTNGSGRHRILSNGWDPNWGAASGSSIEAKPR